MEYLLRLLGFELPLKTDVAGAPRHNYPSGRSQFRHPRGAGCGDDQIDEFTRRRNAMKPGEITQISDHPPMYMTK